MPMLTRLLCIGLMLLMTACQPSLDLHQTEDWQLYKSRFISSDGRLIDTGNNDVSHSEGQGYGMLLAVKHRDREMFDKAWQWTKANLQVRSDTLFMWRKRQNVELKDEDPNNASDGDVLIAWALLEAAKQWQQTGYENEAKQIIADIKNKLVVHWNGLKILLPGEYGFKTANTITVNLSYWVYPAFKAFAAIDNDPVWQQITESGLTLLKQARYGRWQLPPDWLLLNDNNTMEATKNKRFGYDAVRIPLYLSLAEVDEQYLASFADYWIFYQGFTPAWLDLSDNIMDSFGASEGVRAIKYLTLWRAGQLGGIKMQALRDDEDYYSSTLFMLGKLAYMQDQQ